MLAPCGGVALSGCFGPGTVRIVPAVDRIVAIVNPAAGGGKAVRRFAELEPGLRERWPRLRIDHTRHPGHATELARRALEDGVDVVVSVGGDGTANEVLCGFMDEQGENRFPHAELGLLGGGTGGDFLRQLGSPPWSAQLDAIEQPGRAIDYGVMRHCDHQGRTRVRPFLNAASAGLTGNVVARVLRASRLSRRVLGPKGIYAWNSVREIVARKEIQVELRADHGPPRRLGLALAAITNGQFFGGGMWIAPMAAIDDGQLELLYTGDLSTASLLGMLSKVFSGRHLDHPKVEAQSVRHVSLRARNEGDVVLVELDGEQPGRLPAELWVVPGGMRVRVAGLPDPVSLAHGFGEVRSSSTV
ncbi:diacylglycerol kinase family protein [Paraliomyxa miuraensis]|nr:diacylglycerol kinase family protein [Paraliomyxa miuraensis]